MSSVIDGTGWWCLEGTGDALAKRLGMTQADLRRIERAAAKLQESREDLFAAIITARDSGESLRDIAKAAGMSHQRVHQIAQNHRRDNE